MFRSFSKRRRPGSLSRRTGATGRQIRSRRLAVESLEPRQMLSATQLTLASHAVDSTLAANQASFIDDLRHGEFMDQRTLGQSVISQDGRYVAFVSRATDLVSGISVASGVENVFRFDRVTGNIDLVSINSEGTGAGNGPSRRPTMSADGSIVAFASSASDLQSAISDSNGTWDVYVRTFNTNSTSLVSVGVGSISANGSSGEVLDDRVMISADGSLVAFTSLASDLQSAVPDSNGMADLYARNLVTGTTHLISVNSTNTGSGNDVSGRAELSADGNVIAFVSIASNLQNTATDANSAEDIYVRDITAGTTKLVSVNAAGNASGNGGSGGLSMSADGSVIAFESLATNLQNAATDANGKVDVYVRNLTTNATKLVSVQTLGSGNTSGDGESFDPVISANGDVIAFTSLVNNLGLGNNGFGDGDSLYDVYARDLNSNTTSLVSVDNSGVSVRPSISADGTIVAFEGDIDTFGFASGTRVYARDLSNQITKLVSVDGPTSWGSSLFISSEIPKISADGNYVAFASNSARLAAGYYAESDPFFAGLTHFNVFLANLGQSSLSVGASAGGPLSIFDTSLFAKDYDLTFSYDNGAGTFTLQDLKGGPIFVYGDQTFRANATGDGTSTVSFQASTFSGQMQVRLGSGDDRLTIDESIPDLGHGLQVDGGSGDDTLSILGLGGTVRQTTSGHLFVNDSTNFINPIVESVDISGFDTFTSTRSSGLSSGFDSTGTIPAISLGTAKLFNNTNLVFDGQSMVVRSVPLGHNNTNISLQADSLINVFGNLEATGTVVFDTPTADLWAPINAVAAPFTNALTTINVRDLGRIQDGIDLATTGDTLNVFNGTVQGVFHVDKNGSVTTLQSDDAVTFTGDFVAAGTVIFDTPTVELLAPLNTAGLTLTDALTTLNVRHSARIQDGIDLATTGDTVNLFSGTYVGAFHLDNNVTLQLEPNVVIVLPTATANANFLSTLSALQNATAAGLPKVVFQIAGADLATVVASVPQPTAAATLVEIELRVSGPAVNYDVADRFITIVFDNGLAVAQLFDELNPGQRKLVVTGTPGNDSIAFKQMGNVVDVVIAGFATGSFLPASRLVAFGLDGDDVIEATNAVNLSAWLFGDNGNDILKGGKGSDVLQGGANNDQLASGGGRDILIGGGGSDAVGGGGSEDIAISGTTTFDTNNAAMLAILSEWNSARSYGERVANILGTGTGASYAARLNQNYFLNVDTTRGTVTVLDDGAQDTLSGGAGVDLYFANLSLDGDDQSTITDIITSVSKTEQAIDTDILPPPPPPPE